ncbi:MAG: hypothetical protein Q9225_007265 [Loekoesia sp. 1 TL-2023]
MASNPKPAIPTQPNLQILRRLPPNARIRKRPLLRPPIPSPYASASQPKIIYISAHTPFISAVKRVRKLLSLIEKRVIGKVDLVNGAGNDRQKLRALEKSIEEDDGGGGKGGGKQKEEVILKATNRAIEKALGLGLFFQGQDDCRVRLRTGSLGTVDDVVEEERPKGNRRKGKRKETAEGKEGDGDTSGKGEGEDVKMQDAEAEEEELPETQIRKVSVLEVAITLK